MCSKIRYCVDEPVCCMVKILQIRSLIIPPGKVASLLFHIILHAEYSEGTIRQTLLTMVTMFYSAYENDVVRKTPITKSSVKIPAGVPKKKIDFFR